MNKLKLVLLFFLINCTLYGQSSDLEVAIRNEERIERLEKENIELKAKVDAYNNNNASILNTVYFTITAVLGIFGLVNITQLIQNNYLNKKRIDRVKLDLNNYFSSEIELKIDSKIFTKFNEISEIKKQLYHQEMELIKLSCPSLHSTADINNEIYKLIELLNKSLYYYITYKSSSHVVEAPLEGFIRHLENHSLPDFEKRDVYNTLSNEKLTPEFDFYVNKIKELLNTNK